jgi:hypothetical protein
MLTSARALRGVFKVYAEAVFVRTFREKKQKTEQQLSYTL